MTSDEIIIGRASEIAQLKKAFDSKRAEFITVYGRRRIGKVKGSSADLALFFSNYFFRALPLAFIVLYPARISLRHQLSESYL